ncbi:hypothetical protein F5X98DRAFT_386013 [Xylaria grammica]|nr:hypothetical protein F5X98DRAFT_386013 [Xylaria grammica]
MECAHCKKHFLKESFNAHCREHTDIQARLQRPAGRIYGARYDSKNPIRDSSAPRPQERQTETESGPALHSNSLSTRPNEQGPRGPRTHLDKLDKRIHNIIETFPPYDEDGVETSWPTTAEIKCKDCEFRFRTQKECDEHYMTRYCRGADVIFYYAVIDESQPRGYRVEKVIEPTDGIKFPSMFQCRKCDSIFPTELEMEKHQKTHTVSPSRCLHCKKMFSTEYELDDHYEWHDDMEYRHKIDGLQIDNKRDQSSDTNESLKPRKNGELVGMSFISAEDIGRRRSGTTQKTPDSGKVPIRPFMVAGHGRPGLVQINDVTGRKRWVTGEALGHILRDIASDISPTEEEFEAANIQESQGDLRYAMDAWVKILDTVTKRNTGSDEERKFLITTKIARLSHESGFLKGAVAYHLKALDASIKLYGKDSINNFQLINLLAVVFEEQGMLNEAAYLYRRSLLGRIKVLGTGHADTLMTMQQLGNVCQKLGNTDAARSLLEQAYVGYENLEEKDERTTLSVLNNLAAMYDEIGLGQEAVPLLELAIPRMHDAFGTQSKMTCYSICNLLRFTKDNRVADEVQSVIHDIEKNITDHGSTTLRCFADFLVRHHRLGEAEAMYRKVYDWRLVYSGGPDTDAVECLQSLARCLELQEKLDEASEVFRQIVRFAGTIPEIARIRAKKDKFEPGGCTCGNTTTRLCSCCRMKHFFSSNCEQSSKRHKPRYPSVTPSQSILAVQKPIEANNKGNDLVSSEAFYVNPACFATLRMRIIRLKK